MNMNSTEQFKNNSDLTSAIEESATNSLTTTSTSISTTTTIPTTTTTIIPVTTIKPSGTATNISDIESQNVYNFIDKTRNISKHNASSELELKSNETNNVDRENVNPVVGTTVVATSMAADNMLPTLGNIANIETGTSPKLPIPIPIPTPTVTPTITPSPTTIITTSVGSHSTATNNINNVTSNNVNIIDNNPTTKTIIIAEEENIKNSGKSTETVLKSPHLAHTSSEPTFGVILRRTQEQRQQTQQTQPFNSNNNYDVSRSISPTAATASAYAVGSLSNITNISKTGILSAYSSPNMPRRVSFPKSDNELVTGYLEPAKPWEHTCMVKSISEITELYVLSCYKHNTKPLPVILEHLKSVEINKQLRQGQLSLKSIQLSPSDCEALEEVFKRVQYKSINFSSCDLSEGALSALFDMIEYYEATNELDISLNAKGMTHRGWVSCTYMVSRSQELQSLNAQGNPISKSSAENLGHALKTSNLHTLKLEHCGLKGAPLSGLCFKLRCNRILKELWIAYNDLDSKDAETIADLLKLNHYLEFVDISNNNIRDEGIQCVVNALILQSSELERRSMLHRATAIDDDESLSPVSISPAIEIADLSINTLSKTRSIDDLLPVTKANTINNDRTNTNNEDLDDNAFEEIKNDTNELQCNAPKVENQIVKKLPKAIESQESAPTNITANTTGIANVLSVTASGIEENDLDEDTEDTVKSSTIKNSTQAVGQSMLDKLLSMNSDSSSEEGASNLSTDTVAPCYSEDASIISDDIFDGALTVTTNTSTNSKAECIVASTPTCVAAAADVIISTSVDEHVTQEQLQTEKENVISEYKNFKEAINSESNSNSNNSNSVTTTTTTSLGNHNNNNNNNNNNNDISDNNSSDNYSIHHNDNSHLNLNPLRHATSDDSTLQSSGIFEVTADESDCLISNTVSDRESDTSHSLLLHHSAKVLDVNKNTKLSEDFDDTHSTDSAFESASECDISRNLPEEFSRLSVSLESTRLDDIVKELAIETATIATESTESLIEAVVVPSNLAPTPPTPPLTQLYSHIKPTEKENNAEVTNDCFYTNFIPNTTTIHAIPQIQTLDIENKDRVNTNVILDDYITNKIGKTESCFNVDHLESAALTQPKVTIVEDSLLAKHKECANSPRPTPPPPSTSPGGVSLGMRRTESSSAFITQSTRNRSQSSDSLCSDNSLDSSISSDLNFSTSIHINEKLTKNDTLTRQQRQTDTTVDVTSRAPNGLKALAVWNNNLTKDSGRYISELMAKTESLELLNIGKNCLSNEFVTLIKDSLTKNTTITTLGLQSAHLSAKGIETLASILTFGGNNTLQRIDIRDNKLEAESLETLAEVLKSNTTVTQIDIDDEPKRLSIGSDEHLDYVRVLENVRSMCSRNEKTQTQLQAEKAAHINGIGLNKRRGGYYLGSRKISLTCHSRPLIDSTISVANSSSVPHNKLDIKRKAGTRLRSPVPSPPTISPSSSPNRSRFQVFRVTEVSPLTSPMALTPPPSHTPSPPATQVGMLQPSNLISTPSSSVTIPTQCALNYYQQNKVLTPLSLPTSSSLPSMSTITSSTQSIKRLSISPRSRFHVSKIYEDPRVPVINRSLPPITPPIILPPTPIGKTANNSFDNDLTIGHTNIQKPKSEDVVTETFDATASSSNTTDHKNVTDSYKASNTGNNSLANNKKETNNLIDAHNTNNANRTVIEKSETSLLPLDACSSSSSSPASNSSSSLTSPASLSSNNSNSSTSSCTTALASSSVTDNTDEYNDLLETDKNQSTASIATLSRCPIAIFNENDITLTKNTVYKVFGSGVDGNPTDKELQRRDSNSTVNESTLSASGEMNNSQPATQQCARKLSCRVTPTAVDKLRNLFQNPVTMLQRSLSPESKMAITPKTTDGTNKDESKAQLNQQQGNSLVLTCHKLSTGPVWSKLSADILNVKGAESANTAVSSATAVTLEQSMSFLDAASKQLRDFSKQVFRQNTASAQDSISLSPSNQENKISSSGACSLENVNEDIVLQPDVLCDPKYLSTDMKIPVKEYISPEHTINEDTLQNIQKWYQNTVNTPDTYAATDISPPIAASVSSNSELDFPFESPHLETKTETSDFIKVTTEPDSTNVKNRTNDKNINNSKDDYDDVAGVGIAEQSTHNTI